MILVHLGFLYRILRQSEAIIWQLFSLLEVKHEVSTRTNSLKYVFRLPLISHNRFWNSFQSVLFIKQFVLCRDQS